jgi:hypothetical protein
MKDIDAWWPLLDEVIRRWIVNNYWSPIVPFSLGEIERAGGTAADDPYWERRDGEAYLPQQAVLWIVRCPDFEKFNGPKESDPRAAYFRRGWPHRQG